MEKVEFLPLGSVVYLNNGTKKLLIIARGLLMNAGEEMAFFDYGGVPYPEGLEGDEMAYFQHESIKKVVFKGFEDDDNEMTIEKINNYIVSHPDLKRGSAEAAEE